MQGLMLRIPVVMAVVDPVVTMEEQLEMEHRESQELMVKMASTALMELMEMMAVRERQEC